MERTLIYVTDPMCSWCWGFAPVLAEIRETLGLPVEVVAGGLAAGPDARLIDDDTAAYIGEHWVHVEQASGQPFHHATLDRRGWRYDTELACRALVLARTRNPDTALAVLDRMQEAFYADGKDITDAAVLTAALDGLVGSDFHEALVSEASRTAAHKDFAWARERGLTSFPTLLAREGERLSLVTRGWTTADKLIPVLRRWAGMPAEGEACAVEGC